MGRHVPDEARAVEPAHHRREAEIGDDDVDPRVVEEGLGRLDLPARDDFESLGLQALGKDEQGRGVVVEDEDPPHGKVAEGR